MYLKRNSLALGIILALMLSPQLARAATALLPYQFVWQPNHGVAVYDTSGHLMASLSLGQAWTLRHGSDVLTISLQRAGAAQPPLAGTASPAVLGLLAVINHNRAAKKVAPLTLDAQESRCSYRHSQHMASVGYISHDQFPSDICVSVHGAAENVGAAGGTPEAALLFVHREMIGEGPCPHQTCSALDFEAHGHYLNLMNPAYTRIGIGAYSKNGVTWLTEDFLS